MATCRTYNKEKANYIRLCNLLVDIGRQVFQDVFDNIHLPSPLNIFLLSNKLTLNNLKTKHILFGKQWDTLFPTSGAAVTSADFDITLLFLLLRNICNLKAPGTGWDKPPLVSDLSKEADLVRIKRYRNELYAHIINTAIPDKEFQTLWVDIEAALLRLGGPKYQVQIQSSKDENLDPKSEQSFQVLLQCWEEGDEKTFSAVREGSAQILDAIGELHEKVDKGSQQILDAIGELHEKDDKVVGFLSTCRRSRPDELQQPSEDLVYIDQVNLEEERSQKLKENKLFQAIRDNEVGIIKELIANGLNVHEIREQQGKRTVLHCLVDMTFTYMDDLQKMFELFLREGCSVDAIDENGNTAVKLAAEKENIPLITLLAEAGADVNIPDKLSGDTPLHWAAKEGKLQAVNLLIKYKAAIDIQNNSKKSPLHVAVEERHKNVVLLLLHYKANRKLRDQKNDYEPLTYAKMEHFNEIENIFNVPKEQIEDRETMLKYADKNNFAEVVKLFKKPSERCDGIMEEVESDSPANVEPHVVHNYNYNYTVNLDGHAKAAIGPNAKLNIINQSNEDLEDSPAAATPTTTMSTPNAPPGQSLSTPTAPPEGSL